MYQSSLYVSEQSVCVRAQSGLYVSEWSICVRAVCMYQSSICMYQSSLYVSEQSTCNAPTRYFLFYLITFLSEQPSYHIN